MLGVSVKGVVLVLVGGSLGVCVVLLVLVVGGSLGVCGVLLVMCWCWWLAVVLALVLF